MATRALITKADAPTGPRFRLNRRATVRALSLVPCALLIGILSVRVWTEQLALLPRVFNAVDLASGFVLIGATALSLAIRGRYSMNGWPIALSCLAFATAVVISALANLRTHPLGIVLLLVGALTPLVWFVAVVNCTPHQPAVRLGRTVLLAVAAVNGLVGSVQFVMLAGEDSDFLTGTLGVNPNQAAFVLAIGVMYFIARWYTRGLTVGSVFAAAWLLAAMLLASFRTLWIILPLSLILCFAAQGWRQAARGALVIAAMGGVAAGSFSILPIPEAQRFVDQLAAFEPESSGKAVLARSLVEIWSEDPTALVLGVGPGAFNSRAFRTIAELPHRGGQDDVGSSVLGAFYSSDLADRYVIPFLLRGSVQLSGLNTDSPFTSYGSILAETGLLGFLALFGAYGWTWSRMAVLARSDRSPEVRHLALWALLSLTVLLGIAVVDNWLEVTRVTIPVWYIAALAIAADRLEVART